MDYDKKDITILILSLGLVISFIVNINLSIIPSGINLPSPEKQILIVGTNSGPVDLDPVDALDFSSHIVIEQVAETLFTNNLSDPEHPIANLLAESYIWINLTTLEITVRKNIKFHDGEPFNAEAAAWNINRILYLMNHTGEMPGALNRASNYPLFEFPEGHPIINHTEILSEFKIRIFLNTPFSPLISWLANTICSMLSPASTPFNRLLDKSEPADLLIGTGPFVYEYYMADTEVKFHRWDNYWKIPAFFDEIVFKIFYDDNTRNYALVAGSIDILVDPNPKYFGLLQGHPWIVLKENIGADYYYLNMNNDDRPVSVDGDPVTGLNVTWRKAISYAINYTRIMNKLLEGRAVRANSPISPAIFGFNPKVTAPIYNITHARELMVSIGFGNMDWNDTKWSNAEFSVLNYSYDGSRSWRSVLNYEIYNILKDDLDLIGITLLDNGWHFYSSFIWQYYEPPDWWWGTGLLWLRWSPDFLDPFRMLHTLFSNTFTWPFISAQVNDPWLQYLLDETLQEINDTKRAKIYSDIQYYLAGNLFPHAYGFHPKIYLAHAADLYNVPYNGFNKLYVYSIKRNLTWSPFP